MLTDEIPQAHQAYFSDWKVVMRLMSIVAAFQPAKKLKFVNRLDAKTLLLFTETNLPDRGCSTCFTLAAESHLRALASSTRFHQ